MTLRLIHALVSSANEAADELLLEAMGLGAPAEQQTALDALILRGTMRGLCGVIRRFDRLDEDRQRQVIRHIRSFHPSLREAGRSDDMSLRQAAMKLIAIARQGTLSYVLADNLRMTDETTGKSAAEALVALSRWVASQTRRLQVRLTLDETDIELHRLLVTQRPEIEATVARAMDVHRGTWGTELMRAALLLADHPASKTLAILQTPRHGGQAALVRRLSQPPESEHVEAFLLGASHGNLRGSFASALAHAVDGPVLDAVLRRTHWLADERLASCLRHVTRAAWLNDPDLLADLRRRTPRQAAQVAQWIVASGQHDVAQDERLARVIAHARSDASARLRVLRLLSGRPRQASNRALRLMLADPDERVARMAVREVARRKPADLDAILLPLMTAAPPSVRRVISRAVGHAGFEQYWRRFDRLPPATRQAAGRAMLKLLADAPARLARLMGHGPLGQRLKAMQVTQELGLVTTLSEHILRLCADRDARVRSKAVLVARGLSPAPLELLLERLTTDPDPRVRANAIEAVSSLPDSARLAAVLEARTRSPHNRERANAIRALHRLRAAAATQQLVSMLHDDRPEHRISAMWAMRQIGWWQMLHEVGRLAKDDGNLRVRRYALSVLRSVADLMRTERTTPVHP